MHNTSSQLYKYVSNLIIEFFVKQKIQAGDRYNLYLEDIEHIDSLYDSLKKNSLVSIEPFSYTHPEGGQAYSTFSLLIEGIKVIIASSAFLPIPILLCSVIPGGKASTMAVPNSNLSFLVRFICGVVTLTAVPLTGVVIILQLINLIINPEDLSNKKFNNLNLSYLKPLQKPH